MGDHRRIQNTLGAGNHVDFLRRNNDSMFVPLGWGMQGRYRRRSHSKRTPDLHTMCDILHLLDFVFGALSSGEDDDQLRTLV